MKTYRRYANPVLIIGYETFRSRVLHQDGTVLARQRSSFEKIINSPLATKDVPFLCREPDMGKFTEFYNSFDFLDGK